MTPPITVLRLTPAFDWRILASGADARDAVGGMATQVALQVAGTAALGISQEVLTMAVEGAPRAACIAPRAKIRGVGRPLSRGVHRRNAGWLLSVLGELRRLEQPPDLVHAHASGLIEPLLAAIGARLLLRRPLVLTLHCSALVTYVTQSRRDAIVQLATRAAERVALRLSSRTLVLTERVARALGDRAQAMPDWVEPGRFAGSSAGSAGRSVSEFAARHGIPRDRPIALFVGRVSREKGWPALVSLAQQLADRKLHVLVCGPGGDLPALRAAAQTGGVAAAFTLTGAVTRDEVAAAMACSDVLVLPSAHEELGSVLLEAMAAGLPSVAYDVGGTAEAIEHAVTGLLVNSGDERALALAVARVLDDEELRRRAGSEGPTRARARFDATAGSKRLASIYAELAG